MSDERFVDAIIDAVKLRMENIQLTGTSEDAYRLRNRILDAIESL